jgi:hypothetical protein
MEAREFHQSEEFTIHSKISKKKWNGRNYDYTEFNYFYYMYLLVPLDSNWGQGQWHRQSNIEQCIEE